MDREVRDRLLRLLLRSISIIPFLHGPELYDLIRSIRRSQDDLDKQVREAVDALQHSSSLISSLEEKAKIRANKLSELQEEYKRLSELSTITSAQAEALARQIEISLGKGKRAERFVAFGINIVAGVVVFVLGIFMSEPIKALIAKVTTAS
jgi:hypothetical protein